MTDQTTDTAPGPRLGWPWCGDLPPVRWGLGEATAQQNDDGTVTLTWDRDHATCTIVGRGVLDAIVEERNRLVRQVAEDVQRAELLRRQVAELTAERDALADKVDRALSLGAGLLAEPYARVPVVTNESAERLRALLAEALDGWGAAGTWSQGDPRLDLERIAEIRREAGLT